MDRTLATNLNFDFDALKTISVESRTILIYKQKMKTISKEFDMCRLLTTSQKRLHTIKIQCFYHNLLKCVFCKHTSPIISFVSIDLQLKLNATVIIPYSSLILCSFFFSYVFVMNHDMKNSPVYSCHCVELNQVLWKCASECWRSHSHNKFRF